MKKFIVILFVFAGVVSYAQPTSGDIIMVEVDTAKSMPELNLPQQSYETIIINAFKTGNAAKIGTYFGENVDLSILGKANLYSKSQAQQVLQHFFTEHKPKDFKVIHKGDSNTSQYFICELISEKGEKFRVTLNNKRNGTKKTITSLTVEAN